MSRCWLAPRPHRAEVLADQLIALSRSRGSVIGLVIAASMRAAVHARRGELVSAETDVRAVIEIAVEHGMAFAVPRRCTSQPMR